MANQSWPNDLPDTQFFPVRDKRIEENIRTQMDVGPDKVRKRGTVAPREVTIHMVLDGSQRQTFDSFYQDTLEEGSLKFDWNDPVDGTTVEFRFRDHPDWQITAGGSTSKRTWEADLQLEILP